MSLCFFVVFFVFGSRKRSGIFIDCSVDLKRQMGQPSLQLKTVKRMSIYNENHEGMARACTNMQMFQLYVAISLYQTFSGLEINNKLDVMKVLINCHILWLLI